MASRQRGEQIVEFMLYLLWDMGLKVGHATRTVDESLRYADRADRLVLDEETLVEAGRLVWEQRGERLFALGSQGLEYALVAYWRDAGLLAADRTDLIAPAAPDVFGGAEGTMGEGILVLGDELPDELEQALHALSLGCSFLVPDAHDGGAARRFGSLLVQHKVAILTEPEHSEDGVIAAVCGQLGRVLVAPGGVELACQPHCFPVGTTPTARDWTQALQSALGEAPVPEPREAETSERLDRLEAAEDRAQ